MLLKPSQNDRPYQSRLCRCFRHHSELVKPYHPERGGAKVIEVASSHVPMLSQPDVVIGVIREAAAAVHNG